MGGPSWYACVYGKKQVRLLCYDTKHHTQAGLSAACRMVGTGGGIPHQCSSAWRPAHGPQSAQSVPRSQCTATTPGGNPAARWAASCAAARRGRTGALPSSHTPSRACMHHRHVINNTVNRMANRQIDRSIMINQLHRTQSWMGACSCARTLKQVLRQWLPLVVPPSSRLSRRGGRQDTLTRTSTAYRNSSTIVTVAGRGGVARNCEKWRFLHSSHSCTYNRHRAQGVAAVQRADRIPMLQQLPKT